MPKLLICTRTICLFIPALFFFLGQVSGERIVIADTGQIGNFSASSGSSDPAISLKWNKPSGCQITELYRSKFRHRGFIQLAETDGTSFNDSNAKKGIRYWYKAVPVFSSSKGAPSFSYGYISPPDPPSLSSEQLLDSKNRPKSKIPVPMEKYKFHKYLMDRYEESYFMMSFIFMVGRIYLNRGDILAYRDFRHYRLRRESKVVNFYKYNRMILRFESERLYRFIRDINVLNLSEDVFLDRLIRNGVAFCIRDGERAIKQRNGTYKYIPYYRVVGFSTEYFRDYRSWRSHTVVFASSNPKIKKLIKKAQRERR